VQCLKPQITTQSTIQTTIENSAEYYNINYNEPITNAKPAITMIALRTYVRHINPVDHHYKNRWTFTI